MNITLEEETCLTRKENILPSFFPFWYYFFWIAIAYEQLCVPPRQFFDWVILGIIQNLLYKLYKRVHQPFLKK